MENSQHIVVSSADQKEDYVHFYNYHSGHIAVMDRVEAVSPVLLVRLP